MTTTSPPVTIPTRFRSAEARNAAIGRGLRRFGHVRGPVDEELMARIAAALLERDEPGAALADAMRTRAGDPGRVTRIALNAALAGEIGPDAPDALRRFVAAVTEVPDWVDWDLVDRGARVFARLGANAADVLLQLSLIGGYRFGGPPDLLVATGGLRGPQARRRLAETQLWAASLASADALRPGAEGWRATVHVRVMHAMVNARHETTWDVARWGLPVNQADQAATLGLFDGTLILGCRALGVPLPRGDAHALMHLWRWVGRLLGVADDFLTDDERERHRLNYHLLLAAGDVSEAGPELARAAVRVQGERRYAGWPGSANAARGRVERERLLSMLTVFLGGAGMRELGLPVRPPWAFAYVLPLNVARYRVLDRLPGGAGRRERWGRRAQETVLASYFGSEERRLGR